MPMVLTLHQQKKTHTALLTQWGVSIVNISLRSKIDIFSAMLRLLEHNFDPKLNYYLLLYICIHKEKVEDKRFSYLFFLDINPG